MTVAAAEPIINRHVDSAIGTIISDICNFSLEDIELPNIWINDEEIELALPDVSIAKAIAFLTNFGGKALKQTSVVFGPEYGNVRENSETGEFEIEVDGAQVGDTLKGATAGYFNLWKRIASGLDSDMTPILERLNDYEINEKSLPYRLFGLDKKSGQKESIPYDTEEDIGIEEEE